MDLPARSSRVPLWMRKDEEPKPPPKMLRKKKRKLRRVPPEASDAEPSKEEASRDVTPSQEEDARNAAPPQVEDIQPKRANSAYLVVLASTAVYETAVDPS